MPSSQKSTPKIILNRTIIISTGGGGSIFSVQYIKYEVSAHTSSGLYYIEIPDVIINNSELVTWNGLLLEENIEYTINSNIIQLSSSLPINPADLFSVSYQIVTGPGAVITYYRESPTLQTSSGISYLTASNYIFNDSEIVTCNGVFLDKNIDYSIEFNNIILSPLLKVKVTDKFLLFYEIITGSGANITFYRENPTLKTASHINYLLLSNSVTNNSEAVIWNGLDLSRSLDYSIDNNFVTLSSVLNPHLADKFIVIYQM